MAPLCSCTATGRRLGKEIFCSTDQWGSQAGGKFCVDAWQIVQCALLPPENFDGEGMR